MTHEMEKMIFIVFGLLFFAWIFVAALLQWEAKKQTERDYAEFLRTGNDYHFLDDDKKHETFLDKVKRIIRRWL